MSEPREFWVDINTAPGEGIFETFIANKLPSELSENENYFYMQDDRCMRVIEYAAFSDAQEKLRVAVEALEKISKAHLGRMVYEEPNTWSEYTATEALAKIKGKLGEKEEIDPTPYCTVCGSMTKTDKICCQDNVDNN